MSETIISKKRSQCKYRQTAKGKSTSKKYNQSEKGKVAAKRYWRSEKGKETKKRQRQTEKYKVARKRFFDKNKDKPSEYNQNYFIRHPERIKARQIVNDAIRSGQLPRPDTLQCSCGEQAKEYHHPNGYEPEHWFDIIPICIKCHNKLRLIG